MHHRSWLILRSAPQARLHQAPAWYLHTMKPSNLTLWSTNHWQLWWRHILYSKSPTGRSSQSYLRECHLCWSDYHQGIVTMTAAFLLVRECVSSTQGSVVTLPLCSARVKYYVIFCCLWSDRFRIKNDVILTICADAKCSILSYIFSVYTHIHIYYWNELRADIAHNGIGRHFYNNEVRDKRFFRSLSNNVYRDLERDVTQRVSIAVCDSPDYDHRNGTTQRGSADDIGVSDNSESAKEHHLRPE